MYNGHPSQYWGPTTYAQHADDLFVLNLWHILEMEKKGYKPTYLEIGGFDPYEISNVHLLYEKGWTGLTVEPNPHCIPLLTAARPCSRILQAAVVPEFHEIPQVELYMFGHVNGFNTTSAEQVRNTGLRVTEKLVVDAVRLSKLLEEEYTFLTIDIEGMDFEVLKSCRFNIRRPAIICAEIWPQDGEKMTAIMKDKGYFAVMRMGVNMFYLEGELLSAFRYAMGI